MKNTREHFRIDEIKNFAFEVLKKSGYSEENARATAYALVEADKKGIFSHGLAGGTGLEEAVKRTGLFTTVIPDAKPKILSKKYPTIAIIDGNASPGHISSMFAIKLIKKLARKFGIAKVFVIEANHFGAAGIWSEMIANERDLIGNVTCTTSALVKPMGDDPEGLDYTKGAGKEVRLGTNPLAVSIPYTNGIITLDMALTKMAANYCIKAYKTGEMLTISEYVADENYKSTLDPKDFIGMKNGKQYLKGSIFPLGSTHSGYKGDILLRMIEIELAVYGGSLEKAEMGSRYKRVALAFQAQAIDTLYTKDEAKKRVQDIMVDYESKYFGSKTRWPGDRASKAAKYSEKEGIPYAQGQIEMLKRAAEYVGYNFDELIKSIEEKKYPSDIFRK